MRVKHWIGGASCLALLPAGARVASAHPLDGLSAEEMTETVSILKAEGKTTDDARFPLIELKEPDKAVVLAWQPGQPAPRLVTVNVKEAAGTFKGEVDLAARKVVSWAPAAGETMILLEEFLGAMGVALVNPEMQEALRKRGLTKEQVFCIPLTAGAFGEPEEQGRRLMKVPCLASPSGSNFYAKPIEGLFAVIDLNKKEVVRLVDTGVRPVPVDAWGYTDDENAAREGSLRPVANPAGLSQPKGPNYTIDGGQVTWDMWRFRLRVDKRPGVVLSQIEAKDGDQWRSVLYQAHLSEVFVPYMDPDQGWYWRTYMDSGEYGFGIFLSPLRKRVDCPAYAPRSCRRTTARRPRSPTRCASSSATSATQPGVTTRSSPRPRTSPCPRRAGPGLSSWCARPPRSETTTI
jgi:primary-amine oxidase